MCLPPRQRSKRRKTARRMLRRGTTKCTIGRLCQRISLTFRNGRLPGGKVFRSEVQTASSRCARAVLRRPPHGTSWCALGLRDGFRALRRNRGVVVTTREAVAGEPARRAAEPALRTLGALVDLGR